ncbi:hypothetical protein [Alienimonas chondri]|nr:hypothetical protein [Alienimonas chondri]
MGDAVARERLRRLFPELEARPHDLGRMLGWAEAVRLADAGDARDDQVRARIGLLDAATGAGLNRADRVLPAFAWLLAEYDRDPARAGGVSAATLVRFYPLALWGAMMDPAVFRGRLIDLTNDFAARVKLWGRGDDDLTGIRLLLVHHLGRESRLPTADRLVHRLATAADRRIPQLAGPWAFRLAKAVPVPKLWEIPDRPLRASAYEMPHDVAARLRRAVREACSRGVGRKRDVANTLPPLLRRAFRLGPHAPVGIRLELWPAAAAACEVLEAADPRAVRLRLPPGLGAQGDQPADFSVAAAALSAEADRLAAAFDRRNGNGLASARLRRDRAFVLGRDYHW